MNTIRGEPQYTNGQFRALWTKKEVAKFLGVVERTVDRLIARGQLRSYRIGGVLRFYPEEVNEAVRNGVLENPF